MDKLLAQTAVAYLRVSTDEQRDRGTIETQRLQIERFCQRNGLQLVDVYLDEGVSGFTPMTHRPAGAHLLHDARNGRFGRLLVYAFDRLGRGDSAIAAATTLLELEVDVRSVTEADIDVQTAHGWEAFRKEMSFAAHEHKMFRQRSIDGTERLVRAGAWVGGIVPFGYRVAEFADDTLGNGRRKARRLVIANDVIPQVGQSEADIVRMIYQLCADEQWSCHKIAEQLNALGVQPVYARDQRGVLRGKHKLGTAGVWRAGRVRSMIANTAYKGWHHYGKRSGDSKREVVEREVEPIVEADIWERAQESLRNRLLIAPERVRQYVLRGLMRCALCGLNYIGTGYPQHSGGTKAYYVCSGKHNHRKLLRPNGEKCPSKAIKAEWIEQAIWADVQDTLKNPTVALQAINECITKLQHEVTRLRNDATRIKAELGQMTDSPAKVANMSERVTMLKVTIAKYLEQALALENQQTSLRAAYDLLETWPVDNGKFGFQRQCYEQLITSIEVETLVSEQGKKTVVVRVTYCFGVAAVYRRE